jgi:hypothetical protein
VKKLPDGERAEHETSILKRMKPGIEGRSTVKDREVRSVSCHAA